MSLYQSSDGVTGPVLQDVVLPLLLPYSNRKFIMYHLSTLWTYSFPDYFFGPLMFVPSLLTLSSQVISSGSPSQISLYFLSSRDTVSVTSSCLKYLPPPSTLVVQV